MARDHKPDVATPPPLERGAQRALERTASHLGLQGRERGTRSRRARPLGRGAEHRLQRSGTHDTEKHLGHVFDVKHIRAGGYEDVDDLIEDIVPKLTGTELPATYIAKANGGSG